MSLNPYSETERLQAMMQASFKATRAHFNHLPIRYVIDPPVDMLDAKLARQVAIYILHIEFGVARRRAVKMFGIVRSTLLLAIRTIDYRRGDAVFDIAYRRIAARANDLFMSELQAACEVAQEVNYG